MTSFNLILFAKVQNVKLFDKFTLFCRNFPMLLNVRLHDHDLSFHTLLNHEDHLETWLNGFNKIHVMVSNTVLDHYLTISISYVEITSNN